MRSHSENNKIPKQRPRDPFSLKRRAVTRRRPSPTVSATVTSDDSEMTETINEAEVRNLTNHPSAHPNSSLVPPPYQHSSIDMRMSSQQVRNAHSSNWINSAQSQSQQYLNQSHPTSLQQQQFPSTLDLSQGSSFLSALQHHHSITNNYFSSLH